MSTAMPSQLQGNRKRKLPELLERLKKIIGQIETADTRSAVLLDGLECVLPDPKRLCTERLFTATQAILDWKPLSEASAPTICDLPEELLIILLGQTDFATRQRLRRVSKQWKTLISLPDLSHSVYLDARILLDSGRLMYELRAVHVGIRRLWAPAVRKLTFNGCNRKFADFDHRLAELVYSFSDRCPSLVSLHLRNLRFDYSSKAWLGAIGYGHAQQTRKDGNSFQVTFSDSELTYTTADIPLDMNLHYSLHNTISVPLVCQLTDVAVRSGDSVDAALEKLVLSHRDEQTAWLVKCAVRASSDKQWVAWLKRMELIHDLMAISNRRIDEIFRDGGLAELTSVELRQLFTGPGLLTLAAYLLFRRDLNLPRSPFKFCFETDEFYRSISTL